MKKGYIKNCTAVILAVLLCLGMVLTTGIPVYATGDTAVSLNLNSKANINNVSFEVENMFPGDSVSNKYDVQVSFRDAVTVRFRAEVRKGYEKLAEVLKCRVVLFETGKVLYDGLMKDMPDSVDHTMHLAGENTDHFLYEITAYLDTSVGNEYQEKSLIADFVWWVDEEESLAPPQSEGGILDGVLTGDASGITTWCVVAVCAVAVLAVMIFTTKKWTKTGRKLVGSLVLMAVCLVGFGVMTHALVRELLAVEENAFQTGKVSINLNDGKAIIEEDEFLFEPGMVVEKDFFVENDSTIEVYYRIYLEKIAGELSDILEVTLKEGDVVLYKGKAADMSEDVVDSSEQTLEPGETRWLSISFCYPKSEGNKGQSKEMSFSICAEAVQTVNNPNREFN